MFLEILVRNPDHEPGCSADLAAQEIVNAIRLGDREIVIGDLFYRLAVYLKLLVPSVYFRAMEKKALSEQ